MPVSRATAIVTLAALQAGVAAHASEIHAKTSRRLTQHVGNFFLWGARTINLAQRRPLAGMGTMAANTYPMAGGDSGVAQTIAQMRRLISQGSKDPTIHELAANILRQAGVAAFDWAGEVRAIGEWVGRNIRFTRDVYGVETLHSAPEIVRLGIGDCDDFTVLICSLLGTIGVRTRITTISNRAEDPDQFSHVYPEAEVEGAWVPVDFARRHSAFGQAPENFARKRHWSTSSAAYQDVAGLAGELGAAISPHALPGAFRADVAPAFRNLGSTAAAYGRRKRCSPGNYAAAGPPMPGQGWNRNAGRVIGHGHYGGGAVSKMMRSSSPGMGDFSDIASAISSLAPVITAGTTGAANIIRATTNPYGITSPYGVNPYLTPAYSPYSTLSTSSLSSLFTNPLTGGLSTTGLLLLAGLGVAAVAALRR